MLRPQLDHSFAGHRPELLDGNGGLAVETRGGSCLLTVSFGRYLSEKSGDDDGATRSEEGSHPGMLLKHYENVKMQ